MRGTALRSPGINEAIEKKLIAEEAKLEMKSGSISKSWVQSVLCQLDRGAWHRDASGARNARDIIGRKAPRYSSQHYVSGELQ